MGDVQSSQNQQKNSSSAPNAAAAAVVAQANTSDHSVNNIAKSMHVQGPFKPKTNPITEDYKISKNVLGVGINGKVVECVKRKVGEKFALKVSKIITPLRKCIIFRYKN